MRSVFVFGFLRIEAYFAERGFSLRSHIGLVLNVYIPKKAFQFYGKMRPIVIRRKEGIIKKIEMLFSEYRHPNNQTAFHEKLKT